MRRALSWNLTASAFNQGSTLLSNLIIANMLGQDGFGKYILILATVQSLASAAQVSMGFTVAKYVAEFRSTDRERANRILSLCGIVSVAAGLIAACSLGLAAEWLGMTVVGSPGLTSLIRISAATVFLSVLNGYVLGTLSGLEAYPTIGKAGIVSGTFYLGTSACGAWLFGLQGAVAALAVSGALQVVITTVLAVRCGARLGIGPTGRDLRRELPLLWRFAVPAALGGISWPAVNWFVNAELARSTLGFTDLALYGASNNLRGVIVFVPMVASGVWMSLMNHERGLGRWEQYRRLFRWNVATTGLLVVGAALPLAVCGRFALGLYGEAFRSAYPILLILCVSTLPEGLTTALYQVIQSEAVIWRSLLIVTLPRDGLILFLSMCLIPSYGASGVAMAYVAGWSVACVVAAFLAATLLRLRKGT